MKLAVRKLKQRELFFWIILLIIVIVYVSSAIESQGLPETRKDISYFISFVGGAAIDRVVANDLPERRFRDYLKILFTDFNFNKFTIIDLISSFYRILNFAFWTVNIYHLITLDIQGLAYFFIVLGISLMILLISRILLEILISVAKIADNTSNNYNEKITSIK